MRLLLSSSSLAGNLVDIYLFALSKHCEVEPVLGHVHFLSVLSQSKLVGVPKIGFLGHVKFKQLLNIFAIDV